MTDDDFLGLVDDTSNEPVLSPPMSNSSQDAPNLSLGKVIIRKFHTIREFKIYPNGEIYPGKEVGFFEDKIYLHKPKEKKKKKELDTVLIKATEEH